MGAASPAERMRGRCGRGFGRWPPYGAVLLTALYLIVLGWLPAYFGHQACRPAARGEMSRFHAGLDWINCHLRFPPQDRTLEAYAAWLTAAFASVAAYWAWQSVRGVSEQVEEQRRTTFLAHEKMTYEQRLADLAVAIDAQMSLITPAEFSNRPAGNLEPVLRAFAKSLNLRAVLSVLREDPRPGRAEERAQIMEAIAGNTNLDHYVQIARSLIERLDRYGMDIAKDGAWFALLQSIEDLLRTCRPPLVVDGSAKTIP